MKTNKKYRSVIVFPDTHFPYHHKHVFDFLSHIQDKLVCMNKKPDLIVSLGDLIDAHSWSFHDNDPRLFNPSKELEQAIYYLKELYFIFPRCVVIDSNHDSLLYRKFKSNGLPLEALVPLEKLLEAPKGWKWVSDLTIKMGNGQWCYFHHGKSSRQGALSKNMGMSAIQGHYHTKYHLTFWSNTVATHFDCHLGCLIDDQSYAYEYNKAGMDRPMLGALWINEGYPMLIPMRLDGKGNWVGSTILD